MPQPAWRLIVDRKKIPDPQNVPWTQVLDYANPGKLLKIVVVDDKGEPAPAQTWSPKGFSTACSADGDYENKQSLGTVGTPLLASAARGALIGRIGGSTADQTIDASTTPSRIVFAVGRFCVLQVAPALTPGTPASTPVGALFLGVNDSTERMGGVTAQLCVNIYEAL
jgi:hypothetical protein